MGDAFHDKDDGLMALVPGLGMNSPKLTLGSVGIYGPHDELHSVIEVAKTIGHLGHQHPHDAIFLENGDVWSAAGRGRATLASDRATAPSRTGSGCPRARRRSSREQSRPGFRTATWTILILYCISTEHVSCEISGRCNFFTSVNQMT